MGGCNIYTKGNAMAQMLRVIFAVIALICSFNQALTETPRDTVRIIFAMDQSHSMFDNNKIHNEASGEGLLVFLSNFQVTTCAEVTVDYFGWGSRTTEPIPVALKAQQSGGQFAALVSDINQQDLNSTLPSLALITAKERLEQSRADEQLIIFVTDGMPNNSMDEKIVLSGLIPEEVHLAAITFGTDTVETYVQEKILRPGDLGFHVKSASDFENALTHILKSLPILNTPCTG